MDSLGTQYDIIIWDAAPVGLVSDTLNIKEQADATLFVVRQGVSDERTLEGLQDGPEGYQLKHIGIVMNAVKPKSLYGYGKYRYGYGSKTEGYLG
jgi:Mrp family chromosome partitioning ATPase